MHTITLKLKATAYDDYVLNKRFHALSRVHNQMVKHASKLLNKLKFNKEYQDLLAEYGRLKDKNELSDIDKIRKKEIAKRLQDIQTELGLRKFDFITYLKICGKRYKSCLSSQQVQKEAERVWNGVRAVLYKDGREVHFKRFMDFDTIPGQSHLNGIKYDPGTNSISWLKLSIKCNKLTEYQEKQLSGEIKFCELKRLMFNTGWQYYVILYIDDINKTYMNKKDYPDVITGVDIGTSTVATVSSEELFLEELAPKSKEYNEKIVVLQQQLENSRRQSNPDNYNKNGTIKKGKKTWKFSNTYLKKTTTTKNAVQKEISVHKAISSKIMQ